jgi:hypothetical protein
MLAVYYTYNLFLFVIIAENLFRVDYYVRMFDSLTFTNAWVYL